MKLVAVLVMLALTSCTCDVHIKVDFPELKPAKLAPKPTAPAAKPVPAENPDPHVYEYFTLCLTPEGLQKAKDHGWTVITSYERYNGMQYRLRRIVK